MTNPVRIKICGITRPEDAQAAGLLGVDAIGLVFYQHSPRYISIAQAQHIVAALPPFVSVVGLFMDADSAAVQQVLEQLSIDILQFHGQESPEQCRAYGKPYIKSVAMQATLDIHAQTEPYHDAAGFLLDAVRLGQPGGRGECFDWRQVPQQFAKPLILAGGLTPDNVAAAIRSSQCYAVDVSSGVETSKGIKSVEKMRAFIDQVKNRSTDDRARELDN